jgi:RNA polymerase sigma-70 factor (ECF subfamily)
MLDSLVEDQVDPERVRFRTARASQTAERSALFAQLIAEELDRSYRLAAVILRDPIEAEDAVHDAAETAWRRWYELRDVARANAWFRRILVNGCRDRLRRRHRRGRLEMVRRLGRDQHPLTADATAGFAERDRLRRGLEQLAADERVTVALRYEEDLTVPAIGELLGIPAGTVKSRLHNALRKLRIALAEGDE